MIKLEYARIKVGNQPPGCGNDDVNVVLYTAALLFIGNAVAAAENGYGADAGKIGEALNLLVYLLGKLASWRKYQRSSMVLILRAVNVFQYWQQIGAGFTGTGLSAGDDVLAIQNYRDGLLLDGSRSNEPHARNAFL